MGATVAVAGRHRDALESVVGEIREQGGQAMAIPADVTDPIQVERMISETLEAFGSVDILVNNVGGISFGKPEEISPQNWSDSIALNLNSTFFCCAAAARQMIRQQSGKIVNIASSSGIKGEENAAHYAAAKAAVINLTRSLAISWAIHNINVNCVAPGFTATPHIKSSGVAPPAVRKDGTRVPPLLLPNEPEHVADACVFLASDAAAHVTGELMIVRGMFHMERSNDVMRDRAALVR